MTAPRTDTGWRKATVAIVCAVCLTALAIADKLTPETAGLVLALPAGYLGINLLGYRRR